MSLRDRVNPTQLLAVSLAVIMLVSMGGMAFVGGVGAQGGTAEGLLAGEEPVTGELGIASGDGDVLLTGDTDDLDSGVDVDDDGSITVNPSNSAGATQFSGVTVTPNRVGVADGNLATGLNDAVDVVEVEDNASGATPIVVIELAPQSNVSQTDGVAGTHDFIVIGQEGQLPGDITNGRTTDITAYAVNNDDFNDSSEVESSGNFGDTIDALVGTSESELQNENVDDFRIGAGTFDNGNVDVNALQISSDAADGETVHSELIALDDGDSERYFSSVTDAASAAADGDTIDVADGTYTDLEANPIDLSNNELTVSGAGEAGTNLDTNLNVTGNNVTVEGFDIDDSDSGTDGIIDVNAENATIQQLTVDQQATDETGINVTSGANSTVTTVADVTVNSDDENTVTQGDTGLALNTNAREDVVVTSSTFVGHQTQIAGNANVDEGALLTANNFANEDAQSAVARNADDTVVGNAIYGSINAADAENPVDGSIDVSQGTYNHTDAVNITTDNVSVTETDGPAIINNDLEISGSAGDVTVTGFDVNVASTTAATSLDSLTFNGTTASSFDVGDTAGTVTNATFTTTGDSGTGSYDVAVSDTVDVDGAEGGDFTLNGTSAVDVFGADGTGFTLDSDGDVTVTQTLSNDAVDIGSGALTPADVNLTGGEASNYNIADVDGDVEVTGSATTAGGIDVPSSAQNVTIDDADITLAADDDIGVNVTATGVDNEVIYIEDTDVDGYSTNGTGINLTELDTSTDSEYSIEDNDITNFSDGTGVNIAEVPSTGRNANVSLSGNAIAGGSNFVGIQANLSDVDNIAFVENDIVGADVSGGNDSVGIKFLEAPAFGGSFLGGGDGATFNNNTITGHARLIEDRSTSDEPPIAARDYTTIINDNDLNNQFGTLVIGPDRDFEATYGDDVDIDDETGVVYLPGSIDQAVDLIGDNPSVDSADLRVYETNVTVSSAITSTPDRYDDDPVVFPNADDISVTGESEGVIAETTFEIDDGDQRNNHDIRSLTINSDGDAITVDTTKAQSEFTNLTVDADGSGVVTTLSGDDVNVIEVRDSTFDVGANGIDFSGTTDDRDGFVIHNVEVDGPGIGAVDGETYTGLDLSGVEKPGKAGLPVNLTVTETDVAGFSTQVDVGGALPAGVDAEGFLNDVTTSSVTVADNDFAQAILVYESDESTLADNNLYGSVVAADSAATNTENEVIELRHTADSAGTPTVYDHGDTDVDITTEDVTVSGPVTADGSSDVRDNEVVIADSVLATADDVTLEGLAVVAPDRRDGVLAAQEYGTNDDSGATDAVVVGAEAGNDLTVESVSITSDIAPAVAEDNDNPMPVGIGVAAGDSVLDVRDTYVGAHEAGETTGSAVVAQANVDLTVDNSEFRDGATVINTDPINNVIVSEAYGVLAGDGTTPEITDTVIDGFDEDGVNTIDDSLSLTGGEVTDNNQRSDAANSGVGGVVTNADIGAPAEEYSISGTHIENNAGPGVQLEGVGLTMDAATVSSNAGDGVSVNGDDVTISDDTTITSNDAIGADLTVANATVEDSNVSANGNGLAVDAGNDVTVDNNTVSSHDGSAVDVAATTASVTDNTVTDNGQGTILDLSDGANSTVTLNELENNSVGLQIVSGAEDLTVTGNDIQSTDTDIELNDGTAVLDATLNYFGDNGPEAASAAGLDQGDGTIVYDPFLSESRVDDVSTAADLDDTTYFGHDVVVPEAPSGETVFVSVGFPAEPATDSNDPNAVPEVQDYFNTSQAGQIYAWNGDSFVPADPDDEISAFDAFVVENDDSGERVATIEYQNNRNVADSIDNEYQFEKGLNFVAPQQAGTVNQALFPGGPTDSVTQPFPAGENLYGDVDATQVRDSFVSPDSAQAFGNFRSGVGDATVHPHAGYFVTVNENTNVDLSVTERIPTAAGPTEQSEPAANNVADRTDGDDIAATNLNTGEEFENLQIAFAEASDGDRIQLGAGISSVDPNGVSDELVIDNSNLTVFGAGDGATVLEDGNVTVTGDDNVLTDFQVRGANLNTNGNNNDVSGVSVTSASPGGNAVVNGANNDFSDVNAETLTVNGDDNAFERVVSGQITDSGTATTFAETSQTDVVVSDATGLQNAASGSKSFVGSETTITVDSESDIDLSDTTVDVTVDGVTIDGDVTVENAPELFNVTADDVTIEELTLNASDGTAVNLALSGGDSVDVSGTTLNVSGGTGIDAADTTESIDATIEDNTFEADGTTAERYVNDPNNVLDLAAIQDSNTFPANVVLVEGNSDFALTSTVQGGVNVADSVDAADTVSVSAGTYDESVTIDTEGLTLEGPNAGIDGNSSERGAEATINGKVNIGDTSETTLSGEVVIDGIKIADTIGQPLSDGIVSVADRAQKVESATIKNSVIDIDTNAVGVGIASEEVDNLSIENNAFTQSGTGTSVAYNVVKSPVNTIEMSENTLTDVDRLYNEGGGFTEGREIDSTTVSIVDNDVSGATTAIGIGDSEDSLESVEYNISGNQIDASSVGILQNGGNPATFTIENNEFSGDSSTTYVEDSTGILNRSAILNEQGNTFDPDAELGTVTDDGQEIDAIIVVEE